MGIFIDSVPAPDREPTAESYCGREGTVPQTVAMEGSGQQAIANKGKNSEFIPRFSTGMQRTFSGA